VSKEVLRQGNRFHHDSLAVFGQGIYQITALQGDANMMEAA
jgi:hypothetical protein